MKKVDFIINGDCKNKNGQFKHNEEDYVTVSDAVSDKFNIGGIKHKEIIEACGNSFIIWCSVKFALWTERVKQELEVKNHM
jgi:hypothetical protein